jgi:hypothetical protein
MNISANPGRWVRIEGRVTVEDVAVVALDGRNATEHRLLVDGEPLDQLIWGAMHVDPDDRVFGRLRIEVSA